MSDYTAPHRGPAFDARELGKHRKAHVVTTTAIASCPACHRPTRITHTTETRPPYDRIGCFWAGCAGGDA